jgi:hypothetical protein
MRSYLPTNYPAVAGFSVDDQGNEREVEPSGRLIKMDCKGLFAVLEM